MEGVRVVVDRDEGGEVLEAMVDEGRDRYRTTKRGPS